MSLQCSLAITACLMAYMQHTDGAVAVVAVVQVPGAHALEPGDLLGLLVVAGPDQVAGKGPGGGENPLELQAGDHVGSTWQ